MTKEYTITLLLCVVFFFVCGTFVGGCQEQMFNKRIESLQDLSIPEPDTAPKFDFGDNAYYKIYTDRPEIIISDAYWLLNRESHKYEWHYVIISEECNDKWVRNGYTATQRFGLIPERELTRCD